MTDRKRGCFKTGCLGCLVVFGIGLLGFGGMAVLGAINASKDAEWGSESFVQAAPSVAGPSAIADAGGEVIESGGALAGPPPGVVGTVKLDMSIGKFIVLPAAEGESFRVEADYDKARFRLKQEMKEKGRNWTYEVKFGGKGGLFSAMGAHVENEIRVYLPRDVPFHFVGDLGAGESEVDLGGLDVRSVKLDAGMGDHAMLFSEPTAYGMESATFDAGMGEFTIEGLGYARPAVVRLKGRMGEVRLDLRGPWDRDADIQARHSMGEMRVVVPDGVHIDMERSSVALGDKRVLVGDRSDVPPGAPTLKLRVGVSMGELVVR